MNTDNQLAQIEKIAQNARTTWFGLLALLVFVGVTLMGHKDADFFAYGAATQLPLVNIEVPPRTFFYAAPVLTAALYIYLHVYLAQLWPALGRLPLRIDGTPAEERVYPAILTRAGLFLRRKIREEPQLSPQGGGWGSVAIALAMTWSFGQIVLFFLWWRSMPLHSEMLTLWIGFWFWLVLTVGAISGMNLLLTMAGSTRLNAELLIAALPRRWKAFVFVSGAWGLILVSAVGWLRTEGGVEEFVNDPWITSERTAHIIPLAQAQLAEAELTRKPADWLDFEDWKKEYTLKFRKRYDLGPQTETWPEHRRLELDEEVPERWRALTRSLDKISLEGADLRNASARAAFLVGADLRSARLDGAKLMSSRLEGANLFGARAEKVILFGARMEGANLSDVQMAHVDLRKARMEGAILFYAQMQGADLKAVDLKNAKLENAKLTGAKLNGAELSRANLRGATLANAKLYRLIAAGASFRGANLSRAELFDGDLRGTDLWGINLTGAKVGRTSFMGADITDSDLGFASCQQLDFTAAILNNARVSCDEYGLDQSDLLWATGGDTTKLPEGLHVLSCLDRSEPRLAAKMDKIRDAVALHPFRTKRAYLRTREEVRQTIFCDHDSPTRTLRSPVRWSNGKLVK